MQVSFFCLCIKLFCMKNTLAGNMAKQSKGGNTERYGSNYEYLLYLACWGWPWYSRF